MSISNSVFVLCLITAQKLIASFSMNTYRVGGQNFARRCIVEGWYNLWHKCKIDKLRPVCYFGLYWLITFHGECGLCIDYHVSKYNYYCRSFRGEEKPNACSYIYTYQTLLCFCFSNIMMIIVNVFTVQSISVNVHRIKCTMYNALLV